MIVDMHPRRLPTALGVALLAALAMACGDDGAAEVDAGATDAGQGDAAVVDGGGGGCHTQPLGMDPATSSAWTTNGRVVGLVEDHSLYGQPTHVFKGIRYGESTAGANRFAPPVPAGCYAGDYDATIYGGRCTQMDEGVVVGGEDCLFLNVFTPDPDVIPVPPGGYPMMVWIHGGSMTVGGSDERPYWGHNLAQFGVVVVTINYRIGSLGFLAHDSLPHFGNFGIMDQQEALRWVGRNAAAFNGDAGNITLFGESAGGRSTALHLICPASGGLFHKAIGQSALSPLLQARWEAEYFADTILQHVHGEGGDDCRVAADILACLRTQSAAHFATFGVGAKPAYDGVLFLRDGIGSYALGMHQDVPIMLGSTSREYEELMAMLLGCTPGVDCPVTQADYDQACLDLHGEFSNFACEAYPLSGYDDNALTALEFKHNDMLNACNNIRITKLLVANGSEPVYRYLFAHGAGADSMARHGQEIPFVFYWPDMEWPFGNGEPWDASDYEMAYAVQSYWALFAHTGDPNGLGNPIWHPADSAAKPIQILSNETGTIATSWVDEWRETQCEAVHDRLFQPEANRCGDGEQNFNEECDDGNDVDTDSCTNLCTCAVPPLCGDASCDPCETAVLCEVDCGKSCWSNLLDGLGQPIPGLLGCAANETCDDTGTCRPN